MKLLPLSLSVAVAILVGSAAAHAADLGVGPAYSPPPPPAPVLSWTGFYLGGNGGFGGDKFQYPFTVGGPVPALGITAATSGTSSLNSSGFFGGGQAGINWQAAPTWVLGVESDFDAADIEGKANTSATLFSGSVGSKLDWFGTVRGRVGFLVTPNARSTALAAGPTATRRAPPMQPASAWRPPARSATRRTAGPLVVVSNTPSINGCRSRPSTSSSTSAPTDSSAAPSPACRSRFRRRRQLTPSRSASTSSLVGGSSCHLRLPLVSRDFLERLHLAPLRSRRGRGPLVAAGHCGRPSRKGRSQSFDPLSFPAPDRPGKKGRRSCVYARNLPCSA